MSATNNTPGVSLPFLLGLLFLALKLTGVIAWSWLWVLSPFWIPLALTLLIAIVFAPFIIRAKRKAESSPRSAVDEYLDSLSRFN